MLNTADTTLVYKSPAERPDSDTDMMPPNPMRIIYPAIMLTLTTLLTAQAQSNLVDTPTLLLPGILPKTRPSRTKIPPLLTPAPLTTPPPPPTNGIRRHHHSESDSWIDSPLSETPPPPLDDANVIHFQKRIYSALTTGNTTELASHFRSTFEDLNQDGRLGDTLTMLYDMRLMDLQTSVQHARKMRDVIGILTV
jgi:hypothetical protein